MSLTAESEAKVCNMRSLARPGVIINQTILAHRRVIEPSPTASQFFFPALSPHFNLII